MEEESQSFQLHPPVPGDPSGLNTLEFHNFSLPIVGPELNTTDASQNGLVNADVPYAAPAEPVTQVSYSTTGLEGEFLGRVDVADLEASANQVSTSLSSYSCTNSWIAQIPFPPFLWTAVSTLQVKFTDPTVEGSMYRCPVERQTLAPVLDFAHHSNTFDLQLYKWQYVPTIKCSVCPNKVFLVMQYAEFSQIEEHFQSPSHGHRARLKEISASQTAREALMATAGPPMFKLIAMLANGNRSITALNKDYFAKTQQTLLIIAIKNAEANVLSHLLAEGLNLLEKDCSQRTAMHWACLLERRHMVEILIRHDMSQMLMRYPRLLDGLDINGESPLDLVIQIQGIQAAVRLIELEAMIGMEQSPETSYTPLAVACHYGRLDVVEAVIADGADVNEARPNSALSVAIWRAPWRILRALLGAGADAFAISKFDRDILSGRGKNNGTVYFDSEEKVEVLKQYGLRF